MDLFHSIDAILYINLDHRTDRKDALSLELNRLGIPLEKIYRIPGVYDSSNGNRGCLLAHIKALEFARSREWKRVLILEYDVIFHQDLARIERQISRFLDCARDQWDVFLIGGSYVEKEQAERHEFWRIRNSWCAHAYIVNHKYVDKLLACFLMSVDLMKDHLFYFQSYGCSLDRAWKVLQKKDAWFAGKEQLAFQRQSSSDIETCLNPFREFERIICIDNGENNPWTELERLRVDEKKIFLIEGKGKSSLEHHLSAVKCAIETKGRNALIIAGETRFIEKLDTLDEQITAFMKWRGFDYDLFLLNHASSVIEKAEHPAFFRVTQSEDLRCYGIYSTYYKTYYELLKKERRVQLKGSTNSFQPNLSLCLQGIPSRQ